MNVSEQLPVTARKLRRMRIGLIAKYLLEKRHEVHWWRSTFDHFTKSHCQQKSVVEEIERGLYIHWLHSAGYRKHVSLSRVVDHFQVGWQFANESVFQQRPDAVLCSLPIPDLAWAGVQYARRRKIPVVVDIRDWWPEALEYTLPRPVRIGARVALIPYELLVRNVCKKATAMTGITPGFVEWGLNKARRQQTFWDRSFPHGYEIPSVSEQESQYAKKYWDKLGLPHNAGSLVVSFIGSMTRTFDFRPVINAARKTAQIEDKIKFVFCGAGDRLEDTRREAEGLKNIIFNGEWVGTAEIQELLKRSSLGLVPLPDRPDFLETINNKTIEYLSAGVPILVSPPNSYVAELVRENGCGLVVDTVKSKTLQSAIMGIFNHPQKLKEMSFQAETLYEAKYRASKVYREFAEYLEDITRIK